MFYCRYEELLQLNVEQYVTNLENKGEDLSLNEVRNDIKKHSAELDALTEALPQGMSVGLVFINTTKVGCCWLFLPGVASSAIY